MGAAPPMPHRTLCTLRGVKRSRTGAQDPFLPAENRVDPIRPDMPAAPVSKNEKGRKRVLRALDILDTPVEHFSDALVTAAASIANTPMAAMSLIDHHRQWFKGSVGLSVRQTPRADAFCAYAILTPDEPLIVQDATRDSRFCDNPLVLGEPHIRFYAGFPLIVEGQAVGALCVIDDYQRTLTQTQQEELRRLAVAASSWLVKRMDEA